MRVDGTSPLALPCRCQGIDDGRQRRSKFQSAINALSLPGIMIGHRLISPGDEHALRPEEAPAFASSVVKVRRASGAARIVARQLLSRLGHAESAIPKSPSGAPIWPEGSSARSPIDFRFAVAAVAARRDFSAVGIDVEPPKLFRPNCWTWSQRAKSG